MHNSNIIIFLIFVFDEGVVAGEVDEHALMSRKSRTQVFSGRRLQAAGGS